MRRVVSLLLLFTFHTFFLSHVTADPSSAAIAKQPLKDANLPDDKKQGRFLLLTDIHFDPFTDPAILLRLAASPVGDWPAIFEGSRMRDLSAGTQDTSYVLLASAIKAAKASAPQYDYVLVTGDYLAHGFRAKYLAHGLAPGAYQEFAIKTMIFVSRAIQQAFPGTPVFGALGNNDSACDDYAEPPSGPLLRALSTEWKTVASHPEAARDFATGGYYAVPHPTVPGQELIVLNSTFWSPNYRAGCPTSAIQQGDVELSWLREQLRKIQADGKTATLVLHIPPGIDAFRSVERKDCNKPVLLWKTEYADSFLGIINDYKLILRDSYAGHMHRDEFRLFTDHGVPFLEMHITPPLSPIYSNNPAFESGIYDRASGTLLDYAVFYLTNYFAATPSEAPRWTIEYDFRTAYDAPSYSAAVLDQLSSRIRVDPGVRSKYLDFYAAHNWAASIVATKDWQYYTCAQTGITASDFSKCVCAAASGSKPLPYQTPLLSINRPSHNGMKPKRF